MLYTSGMQAGEAGSDALSFLSIAAFVLRVMTVFQDVQHETMYAACH